MGWSLNCRDNPNDDLLDELFLAAGRSLYVANSFESKCKYVLRIAKLADTYDKTADADAVWALAQTLSDKLLGPTLKEMATFPAFSEADIAHLTAAKDARNYIAHQAADVGCLFSPVTARVIEKMDTLRENIKALAAGDNIVSSWVYEIEEKQPSPVVMKSEYPQRLVDWVFGHVNVHNKSMHRSCGPGVF